MGDTVKFLAYPSEVDSIEYQLADVYGEEAIARRAKQREITLCGGASVPAVQKGDHTTSLKFPKLSLKKPAVRPAPKPKPQEFSSKITDLRALAQALEGAKKQAEQVAQKTREQTELQRQGWEYAADEEPPEEAAPETLNGQPHPDDIHCTQFTVQSRRRGKGTMWLPSEQTVECLRKSAGDDIVQIAAGQLAVGDVLILVEEDARGSLFDRVVQLAEDQPHSQYLAAYRKQWQQAMSLLAAKYDCARKGYSRLYADLKRAGSSITTEVSVANWVTGRVMGPENPSSIKAAGELAGIEAIQRNSKDFDKAFEKIRAIHRSLGRRLSRIIRNSSKHVADEDDSEEKEAFDDQIALPLTELLDTIDLAEILSRGDVSPISPHWISRFFKLEMQ